MHFIDCLICLDRLRRRRNLFVQNIDIVDITEDTAKPFQKYIEIIDLTDDHMKEVALSPERFTDFRHRVQLAFQKGKKQTMSRWRLNKRVNSEITGKFTKMEIDYALVQMVDGNEICVANGMVYLIGELKL